MPCTETSVEMEPQRRAAPDTLGDCEFCALECRAASVCFVLNDVSYSSKPSLYSGVYIHTILVLILTRHTLARAGLATRLF